MAEARCARAGPLRIALALLLAMAGGCRAPESPVGAEGDGGASEATTAAPIRLLDLYHPDLLRRSPTAAAAEPRVPQAQAAPGRAQRAQGERSSGEPIAGWSAAAGVAELALRDGLLAGVAGENAPVLALAYRSAVAPDDLLHAIEVRLRASAGRRLAARFVASLGEADDPAALLDDELATTSTALVAGGELRSYVLPPPLMAPTASGARVLLLRPTDAPGASFAIESVRPVFESEHLAELPSGTGWRGLREIYHRSLALRSGESVRIAVVPPDDAYLDLELGTAGPGHGELRLRVGASAGGGDERVLLERTIPDPQRWVHDSADLGAYAGREVSLTFSVASGGAGALALFGSPVVRVRQSASDPRPRGVIVIVADTLRRDHLDAYGYERETAPNLTAMAAEGALFRDAIAQGSWTKVSMPSIFTGLYQSSHGVMQFADRLPDSAVTLAEIFRDAGYATVGYSSVFFTGKFSNMHQGYESFHELNSLGPEVGRTLKTSRSYVDRLIRWLDDHGDVPFFVFLHVFDPHDPFEPASPYDTLWADPDRRPEHLREVEETRPLIEWEFMRRRGLANPDELLRAGFDPRRHVGYNIDWYDGAVRGMDDQIGRLLDHLRELGLDDKVVVVFASDHGEEFHDHGMVFHGQSAYAEMIDVPLIFWGPGRVPRGVVSPATVQLIDVLPTTLELAGLAVPDAIQGRSLVPLMDGSRLDWKPQPAFSEKYGADEPRPGTREAIDSIAVVDGVWKLVHNVRRPAGTPEFELFRRSVDPRDRYDVSDQFPHHVERLTAEIERWRERTAQIALEPGAEADAPLDGGELEQLRALGYVE